MNDFAFARFVCSRLGLRFEEVQQAIDEPESDVMLLGELARRHHLVTRADVDWIVQFQQSMPARRRRYFGQIAVCLGLIPRESLPPLLAAQAERARGVVPALVRRLGIQTERLFQAEREFFGIRAIGGPGCAVSPIGALVECDDDESRQ